MGLLYASVLMFVLEGNRSRGYGVSVLQILEVEFASNGESSPNFGRSTPKTIRVNHFKHVLIMVALRPLAAVRAHPIT